MRKEYDENNIFAKIIRKEIPTSIICSGKDTICFKDINPKAQTHILIIPTGKYTDIMDFSLNASESEQKDFWKTIDKLTKELGLDKSGFRLVANTGKGGGQEVQHFHIHLLAGFNK